MRREYGYGAAPYSKPGFRPAAAGSVYHPPGTAAAETRKTLKRAILPGVKQPEFDTATRAAASRNKQFSLTSSVQLGLEEETGAVLAVGHRQHRHPRGTQTDQPMTNTTAATTANFSTANTESKYTTTARADASTTTHEYATSAATSAPPLPKRDTNNASTTDSIPTTPASARVHWSDDAMKNVQVNLHGAPGRIVDGSNPLTFACGERLADIPKSLRI